MPRQRAKKGHSLVTPGSELIPRDNSDTLTEYENAREEAWRKYLYPSDHGPRTFPTPEVILDGGNEYIRECGHYGVPMTWSGVCVFLGVTRWDMELYRRKGGDYARVINYLREVILMRYETALHGPNATGSIFAMKTMGVTENGLRQDDEASNRLGMSREELSDREKLERIKLLMHEVKQSEEES